MSKLAGGGAGLDTRDFYKENKRKSQSVSIKQHKQQPSCGYNFPDDI